MPEHVFPKLAAALSSVDFSCPGGHRLDSKRGEQNDYFDELMDERGESCESFADLVVQKPDLFLEMMELVKANWVEQGACPESIEIMMEYDGEYGEFCYPVASGKCAEALGLDVDETWEHPIWSQFGERRRLWKLYLEEERDLTTDDYWSRRAAQIERLRWLCEGAPRDSTERQEHSQATGIGEADRQAAPGAGPANLD